MLLKFTQNLLAGVSLLGFFLGGCVYENTEELLADPLAGCDSLDVGYSSHVLPILQQNCLGCHSQAAATAGIILEGYDNVKTRVDDGKLIGVITHAPGFPAMPRGRAKLSDCTILQIQKWIDAGALDN